MPRRIAIPLLLLAVLTHAALAQEARGVIRDRLQREFDTLLEHPQRYHSRALEECRSFPEGDLFPFVFPAFAYANLAVEDPRKAERARLQIAKLIDLAIPTVVRRVRPPAGRLERLIGYKGHATYLGQLNLALGCYRLAGGNDRYEAIHRRISEALLQALIESEGRPLESYPAITWPFDTIPVVLSLWLRDRHTGMDRVREPLRRHLAWIQSQGTHPEYRLPFSRYNPATCTGWEVPRGCDLSLRLCLLPHLDRGYAEALYRRYTELFWIDRGPLAGFAEWPSAEMRAADIDSGPIIDGIGLSATGLGIGAAIANRDRDRLERMLAELGVRDALMAAALLEAALIPGAKPTLGGMIALDPSYFTGFLYGDAVLFYIVSWTAWEGVRAKAP